MTERCAWAKNCMDEALDAVGGIGRPRRLLGLAWCWFWAKRAGVACPGRVGTAELSTSTKLWAFWLALWEYQLLTTDKPGEHPGYSV